MTAKAPRNRRSNRTVSLTLAAIAAQAIGTPSPSTATWYLVPRLPRSVGLGPVRSPPRLARTEHASRIRSGWPRSMPTSRACTFANRPVLAHRIRAAAQGRGAGLVLGGDQAAPWRALAQEAPQRRHHPDGVGWWVARPAARPVVVAGVDHRGDEMQELDIQCCCPCLTSQAWAAAGQGGRSGRGPAAPGP